MSLTQGVVRGVLSVGVINILRYLLTFLVQVLLARFLTPDIFGIVALAASILTIVTLVGRWGMREAIMQDPDGFDLFSTIFWLRVCFAVTIFVVVVLVSFPVRSFYSQSVAAVLTVLAATRLFRGVCDVFAAELQRRLRLTTIGAVDLVGVVVAGSLSVWLSWRNPSVSSLVAFYAIKPVVRGVGYLLFSPQYPALTIDRDAAQWFAAFAKGMFVSKVLRFAEFDADDYLVGTIGGTTVLGAYSVVWRVANGFVIAIFSSIQSGMLPAFAEVQDDDEKSRRGLEFLSRMQLHMTVPGYVFVAVAAPELTILVFGPQWESAIPAMRSLALAGILFPILETGTEFYYARGEAGSVVQMQVVFLVVLVVTMVGLLPPLGVLGAGLSLDAAVLIGCVVLLTRIVRDVGFSPLSAFGTPAVAGTVAVGVAVAVRTTLLGTLDPKLLSLAAYAVLVGGVYYATLLLVGRDQFVEDVDFLRTNLVG